MRSETGQTMRIIPLWPTPSTTALVQNKLSNEAVRLLIGAAVC